MIAAIHGILEQGFVNRAAKFNGVDTGTTLRVAGAEALSTISNNFHLKARVRITHLKSCYIISTQGPCLIYGFAAGKFEFFPQSLASGTGVRTAFNTSVTDSNWHTVEWIYDGVTLTGKLDGVVDVTKTVAFSHNNPVDIVIGKYRTDLSGFFGGELDWVKIGKNGTDIHHWDMNEESPASLFDSIGNLDLQTVGNIQKVTV